MKGNLTEEFLNSIDEVERILLSMLFIRHSFNEKGFAYFIEYKKASTIVEFILGRHEPANTLHVGRYVGGKRDWRGL